MFRAPKNFTFNNNLDTTWRQLGDNLETTWIQLKYNFVTTWTQRWHNYDTTMTQLWQNFETSLRNFGLIWDNSKTTLGELLDHLVTTFSDKWAELTSALLVAYGHFFQKNCCNNHRYSRDVSPSPNLLWLSPAAKTIFPQQLLNSHQSWSANKVYTSVCNILFFIKI